MLKSGITVIVGLDEPSRGRVFGPIVASAVVLPPAKSDNPEDRWYLQICDPNKLGAGTRELLATFIKDLALATGYGIASDKEVQLWGPQRAGFKAMHRALDEAFEKYQFKRIIIDGPRFEPYKPVGYLGTAPLPFECFKGGNRKHLSVASATIVAKVLQSEMKRCIEQPLSFNQKLGTNVRDTATTSSDTKKRYPVAQRL